MRNETALPLSFPLVRVFRPYAFMMRPATMVKTVGALL